MSAVELREQIDSHDGALELVVTVTDEGRADAVALLAGVEVMRHRLARDDTGNGSVSVEFLGPWAAGRDNSQIHVEVRSGMVYGTSFGQPIEGTPVDELQAAGTRTSDNDQPPGVTDPSDGLAALQRACDRILSGDRQRHLTVQPEWKLPKPGCKMCTAKCSAIGVGCVAACAALTGPLAHLCAAGCAAQGAACVSDCPCD